MGGDQSRRAAVLTVSDGVSLGTRQDASGPVVAEVLAGAGYDVRRLEVVADDRTAIERAIRTLAAEASLVVTTGGTGLGPRDVTPEATRAVVERDVPGLAEAMRAAGRRSTPMADLSRGVAGALGSSLVVNLPGSERGARESLEAVLPVLPHALEVLAGDTAHQRSQPAHRHDTPDEEPLPPTPAVVATAVRVHGSPPCRPGQRLIVTPAGPAEGTLGCAEFDQAATRDAAEILRSGEPAVRTYQHERGTVEVYLEPRGPRSALVVLGATPVALWLLRWAADLGYDTVLVEPKSERVTPEHRAAAGRVREAPDELPTETSVDAVHTDHEAPLVAEHVAALVRGGARFVGVMGSRRHAAPHLDDLRAMGLSDRELAAVRTPVGLDLGGRTPQEIALSILAGLVAAREGRPGGWLDGEAR
jgi:molybdopterin adenylyltransferase